MSNKFNVVVPRKNKNTNKTYWHRIGIAFQKDKGMSVKLESLPLPDENGEVWINLFPQEVNLNQHNKDRSLKEIDDEIPF